LRLGEKLGKITNDINFELEEQAVVLHQDLFVHCMEIGENGVDKMKKKRI